jgi:uncharacterized protein involved in type VI secretion and phage assembly
LEPLERLLEPQTAQARQQPVHGLVTAIVRAIEDDGTYRLDYLTMGSDEPSAPARVMMPMAGGKRGMHFFPEKGDEVVVAFELGDTNLPVILGAVWNNNDRPPDQAKQSPDNHVRTIVSRSGHELTFDDTPGAEKITLKSKSGHKVTLRTARGAALILDDTPPGSVTLRTAGGSQITISDADGITTISAPLQIQFQSSLITLQANAIQLTTTGVVTSSTVVIDGKPFGAHTHNIPPATPTGPVTP